MMNAFMIVPIIIGLIPTIVIIGLIVFLINKRSNTMEPTQKNSGMTKDFFLQLSSIAAFYATAIALVTLLFEVINVAYPQVTDSYGYYSSSISLQVAVIIVAFPIFLIISRFMQKNYEAEPALRDSLLRRGFAYFTLFIAGGIVVGDLITVIYLFLDGEELTVGFLLKVLTLLVVAGGIFLYYVRELKNAISPGERNMWRVVSLLVIISSILVGFMVIGSPASQRGRKLDLERVQDLQTIQREVVSYFQQKGSIPDSLSQLNDSISGFKIPTDPKTGAPYEYTLIGQSAKAFELCAVFAEESKSDEGSYAPTYYAPEISMRLPENWQHGKGRTCYQRSIDPDRYPVYEKAVNY